MENKSKHKHIMNFNPDVMLLEQAYQDYLYEIQKFNAGKGYENFNDFVVDEANDYKNIGDGVTYTVWNVILDDLGKEEKRELVAYYTLAATSIPYEDRIRLDEEEAAEEGKEFDIQIYGISAIEIKMFAVDEKYQNIFFEYEGQDLPISAWIMRNIISYLENLSNTVVGFKAIFLHSVPQAESFYEMNGFNKVKINMKPLQCIDSEFTSMYLALKEIKMNYDD